jgi:hypothetical protein
MNLKSITYINNLGVARSLRSCQMKKQKPCVTKNAHSTNELTNYQSLSPAHARDFFGEARRGMCKVPTLGASELLSFLLVLLQLTHD